MTRDQHRLVHFFRRFLIQAAANGAKIKVSAEPSGQISLLLVVGPEMPVSERLRQLIGRDAAVEPADWLFSARSIWNRQATNLG